MRRPIWSTSCLQGVAALNAGRAFRHSRVRRPAAAATERTHTSHHGVRVASLCLWIGPLVAHGKHQHAVVFSVGSDASGSGGTTPLSSSSQSAPTGGDEPASARVTMANWGDSQTFVCWRGCCDADGNPVRCSCHAARQQTTIRRCGDSGVSQGHRRDRRGANVRIQMSLAKECPDFLTLEAYKHI
jgi:hypothetical protein